MPKSAQSHQGVYEEKDYRRDAPKSKQNNCLLMRRPVGKVKPTTYDLPPPEFAYGFTDRPDDANARDCISSWRVHEANPDTAPARNFVHMNRSIQMGKSRDEAALLSQVKKPAPKIALPYDSSTTFGRPSRPESTIASVLSNEYQREAILARRTEAAAASSSASAARAARRSGAVMSASPAATKASMGHTKPKNVPPPPELFKMQRFKEVPSRIRLCNLTETSSSTASTAALSSSSASAFSSSSSSSSSAGSAGAEVAVV